MISHQYDDDDNKRVVRVHLNLCKIDTTNCAE